MISKCANPACSLPFHYFRAGRLFQMDFDPQSGCVREGPFVATEGQAPLRAPQHHVEHFWLCGECARRFTLRYRPGEGVVPVPLPPPSLRGVA